MPINLAWLKQIDDGRYVVCIEKEEVTTPPYSYQKAVSVYNQIIQQLRKLPSQTLLQ